ncbi:hypothetical protein U27_05578 [Candidatus Vecturithrix granuli]|uniref:Uncharacterized protein n=1 Tax=Vecturithrix granuli TaxID=1499967 RepID=A0A081C1Z9_VECG1|nr:hypothetical protein U27_05578 [Candidatus Vecturithrix granuli]
MSFGPPGTMKMRCLAKFLFAAVSLVRETGVSRYIFIGGIPYFPVSMNIGITFTSVALSIYFTSYFCRVCSSTYSTKEIKEISDSCSCFP